MSYDVVRGFVRLNGRTIGLTYPRSLFDRFDDFERSLKATIPVLEESSGLMCYQVFVQPQDMSPKRVYAFKFMMDERVEGGE